MNNRYGNVINDYWEILISFISALISAYDTGTRFLQLGWITDEKLTPVGILFFLFFGFLAIIKFAKRARNAERTTKNAIEKMIAAENYYKELHIAYESQKKELEEIKVEMANGSVIAKTIHNPVVNNIFSDDNKKKETLNKLARLVQEVTEDINSYSFFKDRRGIVIARANDFFEFSQSHIAEMSPELNKLIFNKMFPAVTNSIREVEYYCQVMEKIEEVRLSGEVPAIFDSTKMTVVIHKMFEIRDAVYIEINKTLN